MEQAIIIDKSTMQMLGSDESGWMHTFFSNVIPSIYLMELLGNLKKEWGDDRDAKDFLSSMARKTYGMHTYHNMDYRDLIEQEVIGHHIELSYRPLVGGAKTVTDADGRAGVILDVAPESKDLMRWSDKRFTEAEAALSEEWRAMLRQLDKIDTGKEARRKNIGKITTIEEAVKFADEIMERETWRAMKGAFDMFEIDKGLADICKARWIVSGRPSITKFLPYLSHVMRVNLVYDISLTFDLVPNRETNIIDIQYLYYLPFCYFFASNDKVHCRIAPYLMTSDQAFIKGDDFKEALKTIDAYYDALPPEEKTGGTSRYARYLPLSIDTAIHRAYDKVLPKWRRYAEAPPPPPITKEENDRLMAHLKPMMDAIKARGL